MQIFFFSKKTQRLAPLDKFHFGRMQVAAADLIPFFVAKLPINGEKRAAGESSRDFNDEMRNLRLKDYFFEQTVRTGVFQISEIEIEIRKYYCDAGRFRRREEIFFKIFSETRNVEIR